MDFYGNQCELCYDDFMQIINEISHAGEEKNRNKKKIFCRNANNEKVGEKSIYYKQ